MLKVGLTGGIGSGKSTVVSIFKQLGVPVFIADDEAKRIMVEDKQLVESIKKEFGDEVYTADGTLDRARLASLVFNNKVRLSVLNSLIHPATLRAFEEWCQKQIDRKYVLKEAAVLFESGAYKQNDINILVTAPEEARIKRVIQRDGSTEDQVRSRINNQLGEDEKLKLADFVIVNDEKSALIPQVLNLHRHFLIRAND
ncbi:dephospho-CoA kinase [Solitalea lacus]|uniref:dephospho-CoA kinase n=1 Tax=Solitalea lacus TaxID=2911172 RepID=UPI001ED9F666|nr:dephospho-CoA kinase [Solitalea lacus]UKJ06436.1 dephospho-CoA kinase [Solitalea lacus]